MFIPSITFIFILMNAFLGQASIPSAELEKMLGESLFLKINSLICPPSTSECIKDFDLIITQPNPQLQLINQGSFGSVFEIDDNFVLKVMESEDPELVKQFIREINLGFKAASNPNTHIAIQDSCCSQLLINNQGVEAMRYYIKMVNYKFGNLRQFLRDENNIGYAFSPQWKWSIIMNIIDGIETLHTNNYVHRDLKLENIFLTDPYHAFVGDLGFALKIAQPTVVQHFAGTLGYAPPEALSQNLVSLKFDVYSLAVIIFEIMNAINYTFSADLVSERIMGICKKYKEQDPLEISSWETYFYCENIQPIIHLMMKTGHHERPTIQEIKAFFQKLHPEFKSMQDKLQDISQQIKILRLNLEDNDFNAFQPKYRLIV